MDFNYWKEYSPEKFETIVKKNPMSPEKIDPMILDKEIIVFSSGEMNSSIAPMGNFKYKILINSNDDCEKQKKDLIHKIAHGFYKISVFSAKGEECPMSKIEEIITKETEDFCDKYTDYVDTLYTKLLVRK
jgi:hypothetical protein